MERIPIDPPPVVEVFDTTTQKPVELQRLSQNLRNFVVTATLWNEQGREIRQLLVTLPDGKKADVCVFADLSVKVAGTYRIRFDLSILGSNPTQTSQPASHITHVYSEAFTIMPPVCVGGGCEPGEELDDIVDGDPTDAVDPPPAPTELTRHLQSQGVMILNYANLQDFLMPDQ
ncbi:hypothetical protein HDV00_011114 [Rhizophlyctis rosea]|nr:hypothetical protein HDV00_011114 [Rhizophlyctis rosea]